MEGVEGPRSWRAGLGRRPLGRVATVAVLALFGVSSCGGSEARDEPVRPVTSTDPAVTFAPLIHLHAKERFLPTSTRWLLERSTLEWKDGCPEVNLAAGPVSQRTTGEGAPRLIPGRLGKPSPYRYRARGQDCFTPRPRVYSTAQHTRPGDAEDRPAGLRVYEGFNLDILLKAYGGEARPVKRGSQSVLEGIPAYFEQADEQVQGRPGRRIVYWLAYAYSQSTGADGETVLAHEGDWERVEVLLREGSREHGYLPVAVRYFAYGRASTVPWRDLELVSGDEVTPTHPVLFAAAESHTPYVTPGRHERRVRGFGGSAALAVEQTDACGDCPRWRTWERLRRVREEPWYGYGGGWGVRASTREGSGPAGPSRWDP